MNARSIPILFTALAAAGCETGGDAVLVAEAEQYRLSVNEAVTLLTPSELPNEPNVVEAVSELWIDYVLLGEAARRDTTLSDVDVAPLVEQQVERRLILALRDSVIQADTAVTDAELRTLYEGERPGVTVDARHILLTVPEGATAAQADSVRELAARIREQAVSGAETFETLARRYSQDRGTAGLGGELGTLGRGEAIPTIEEAIFDLEPGEVSELVETPYGIHVFRVDGRAEPTFEEIGPTFRAQVQQRRYQQAESLYIAAMIDGAGLRPVEEAADLTRRMADRPGTRLSRRAADRPVVEYEGGRLTLEEVRDFMQTSPPEYRGQVLQAPDEVVEDEVLLAIVQRELLLRQARERGLTVPPTVRDSLTRVARERFVDVAGQLGVLRIPAPEGTASREAVEERVLSLLREILSNDRDVQPLGAVAYALRKQYANQILESGVQRVVQRIAEARGGPRPADTPDASGGG
ncbi:MAG TPA: peptidylprolyl isomerase [Longimicrobiales bacterium]|nr:peptidylprolyl isomerase [Longimicrobiales bacterium]